MASDLNSAEQTGVGLTAALGERELKLPAPFGEAPSQPPVFILGGTDERLRVTLGPARLSPWVGAWEAGLGRLAGQSRPFVLSPFSVEHLFTREPWALGVGPGLGTRESDNWEALPYSRQEPTPALRRPGSPRPCRAPGALPTSCALRDRKSVV